MSLIQNNINYKIIKMKLHKALKLKKKLTGEIAHLKSQINSKNSYIIGSLNADRYNMDDLVKTLLEKINTLIGLKYAINEANHEIQANIYRLSEYKALIAFWNSVSVAEGTQSINSFSDKVVEYRVKYDEEVRDNIVNDFQKKVDAIQEEIDTFNYTTNIPWGDEE